MYNSSALLYNKRRIEISDIVIYMSYKYFFLSAVGVRNKDMRRSLGLLVSYVVRSIKFQKSCIDESRSLFCPQCKSPPWFIGIQVRSFFSVFWVPLHFDLEGETFFDYLPTPLPQITSFSRGEFYQIEDWQPWNQLLLDIYHFIF